MPLNFGDEQATSGMAKTIYEAIDEVLSRQMVQNDISAEDIEKSRETWKLLSYAIAKGVIEHIKASMEIRGVQCRGDVDTTVQGSTGPAMPNNHQHNVNLSGEQIGVVLTQSNDGTGLVN